ncbi:FKBP-type peptidyl-prolyl cis-trans isomerase [Chitinophaga ginsengisoli]|uniref:Peptidyl-prolyl cis-trans isomerase n=1 Tax=Chitinophaga ginsengisoli TaxID=363837 RepID=A0A2P8GDR4_9BACT|nr:FKBP-type peptidyl-prolyl cis-trans isomerase [Chitinophaga ginsengisoli]PSL32118.1 FKBP-type peptidyl-prolyl isomerase-like protein [Chitinophaga ginsengisoli]
MNAFLRATFCFLLPVFLLTACAKDEYSGADVNFDVEKSILQDSLIQEYISDHNLTMEHDFNGLYFKIEEPGDSDHPDLNSIPTLNYTRSNLNDSLLDASFGDTDFDGRALKDHILGWQIGLQKIGKGGKIFMIIPSRLAFGSIAVGNIIPANTVLVCDVELVDFK